VHPNMPVTPDELLADLRDCFRARADGVHLPGRRIGYAALDAAVDHFGFYDDAGNVTMPEYAA